MAAMADPDKTPSGPHALGDPASLANGTLREIRVAHIVEMMRDFKFARGRTAKELAKEWDLSLDYVHELTAEASKRVRGQIDVDSIAAEVVPGLLVAFRTAVENGDPKSLAAVGPMANVLADIAGLKSAKKHELTGANGGPVEVAAKVDLTKLSDDDLAKLASGGGDPALPPGTG